MSTPERVSRIPQQDDESSTRREASLSTAYHPRTHRREKRLEIGFFIRRIVNGWISFYKQFPPGHRAQVHAQVKGLMPTEADAPEYAQPEMVAMSHSGPGDVSGGGVTTKSGTSPGSGDGGPVGSTSYEFGVFAKVTTTSDDEEES